MGGGRPEAEAPLRGHRHHRTCIRSPARRSPCPLALAGELAAGSAGDRDACQVGRSGGDGVGRVSARGVGCGGIELGEAKEGVVGGVKGCRRRRRWLPTGGSLGGRWPRGAAEGKRRKVPIDTKVPGARVEARGAGGEAGVGEDAGAAGSLETRRLRAGGLLGGGGALAWGAGRHKAPGSPLAGGSHP